MGLLYAAFVRKTGWGIPCPFRLLMGLKCPGCGVSHMALCLLQGDLSGAFAANGAILCLLPIGAVLALKKSISYVKTGKWKLSFAENRLVIFMIVFLVVFGIGRNIAALT